MKLHLLILFLVIVSLGCSPDNPVSPVKPAESDTLKFKSSAVIETEQINDGKTEAIEAKKAEALFGKRIIAWCPKELRFSKDSLLMVKSDDVVEAYKIKWEKSDLFVYNDITEQWQYCGSKNDKTSFALNTGFYMINKQSSFSTIKVTGQEYFLKSSADLDLSSQKGTAIWLRAQYIYE